MSSSKRDAVFLAAGLTSRVRRQVFLLLFAATGMAHAAGMGTEDARHLLNRTGFDAHLDEIEAYARLSRREALLRQVATWLCVAAGALMVRGVI